MTNEKITKKDLDFMLSQEDPNVQRAVWPRAEQLVKLNKLPYKIIYGTSPTGARTATAIEVGDTTDAWLSRFITENEEMLQIKEDVKKLSKVAEDIDQLYCVMISGPTGTGKEIIANALHGDREGKMASINCAGLPSELVESELFGHVVGAFTGAVKNKEGMMTYADKGTLFLDEIGELPLPAQAKLLRAIQSKKIRKVGAEKSEDVTCRIICATHRDIPDMCRKELFRTDLYARISTFELHTTSLKERHGDLEPIVKSLPGGLAFLEAIGDRPLHTLDLEFNVRSLQQHVKRYKVLGKLPV